MELSQGVLFGLALVIAFGALLYLFSSSFSPTSTTTTTLANPVTTSTSPAITTTTLQNPTLHTVIIVNRTFIPNNLTINVGDTVIWKNQDDVGHSVQGSGLASPYLRTGESWNYTFTTAKEYLLASGTYPRITRMTITAV